MIGGGEASKTSMRRVRAKQAVKSSIRAVTLLSNPIVVDGLLGFDEFNNHIGTFAEINSALGRLAGAGVSERISGAQMLSSLHNNIFVRAASSYCATIQPRRRPRRSGALPTIN